MTNSVQDLLVARYYRNDEDSWGGICWRVVKHLYGGKHSQAKEDAYVHLMKKEFIPSSPVLMNAGSPFPMMCSCFVLPVEDSIPSIMKSLTDTVMIQKYGGGVGLNFSAIRPEGSQVLTTGGRASGPVSFMGFWNEAMNVIRQGGKRQGAMMGVLDWDHPNIDLFLQAKEVEGKLTNFNLSVALDSMFFTKLHSGHMDANELLRRIAQRAWSNGEPGVLFMDNINMHRPYGDLEIRATNPCWSAETRVWTINGPRTFKELAEVGEDVEVLTEIGGMLVFRTMRQPRRTGVMQLWEVALDNGTVLRATGNHKLVLKDGTEKEVSSLVCGDRLSSVYRYKANSKGYLRLTNGVNEPLEHLVVAERKYGRYPEYPAEHVHHLDQDKTNNTPENLRILPARQHNSERMLGEGNPMYGVWDERNPLYGISVSGENNPNYRQDVTVELVATMFDSGMTRREIAAELGCSRKVVRNRLKLYASEANHTVVSATPVSGVEAVFNGTVDETHSYFVMAGPNEAILSKNCGEVPLPPYGACCLGSINLNAVLDESSRGWGVDHEHLYELVKFGVECLNRVIDTSRWPTPETREFMLQWRPIGLGVMGLADYLAKLGFGYGTPEGRMVASDLMREIRGIAEQVAFGEGHNNTTLLSMAPTGSIAMMAGASYGIEPYFNLSGTKTVETGSFDTATQVLSEVLAKRGYCLTVDDYKYLGQTGSVQGTSLPDDIKEIFRTANEIPYMEHLLMQAAIQEYVDNSVSKTINLPGETTVEEIEQIILSAHALGLKGLTVYRDKSRDLEVFTAGCPTGTCSL